MPNPAALREQRLRKTKAQLIDEIDTLEQRARFTSENPNPVLRVMPDGTVHYANDAAIAVKGLSARASVRMRSKTFEALEKRGMIFQGSTVYDCSLTEKGRRAFEAI